MSIWRLMNQFITIEPFAGVDGYGAPTFSATQSLRGRVANKITRVKDDKGDDITSSVLIYLDSKSSFTVNDRITLPSGFSPSQPKILKVYQPRDRRGIHHTEIYC